MLKKIDLMHATFGVDVQGRRCKDCPCLVRVTPTGKTYLKCTVYGVTCSDASDWVGKWTACGRFGKQLEPGEYSVLHITKGLAKAKAPEVLHGQIKMEV